MSVNFGKQKTTPKGTAPQPTRRNTKAKRAATFKMSRKSWLRFVESGKVSEAFHFSSPRYFLMQDDGSLVEIPRPSGASEPLYEVVDVDVPSGTITVARLPGV